MHKNGFSSRLSDSKQAVRLKALRREYLPQVCKNSRVARLNGYNVKFIAIVINGINTYFGGFYNGRNQSKQEGSYPL